MSDMRVVARDVVPLEITGVFDLIDAVGTYRIDTLVCGGIDRDTRDGVLSVVAEVIDNVACPLSEIEPALECGKLISGFRVPGGEVANADYLTREHANTGDAEIEDIDCILCQDRVCLRGGHCPASPRGVQLTLDPVKRRMIETAFDIAQERERKLCRIAETVYFCLEMDYRRIGIAFCTELLEPTRILAGVLRRFFEVVPVCCRAGGTSRDDFDVEAPGAALFPDIGGRACNPQAQADILNRRKTDFNLAVGLCVGSDSLFARTSHAPVSTLFVKDRSLANNPIGALYSGYYLRESIAPAGRDHPVPRATNNSILSKEET